MDSMLPIITTSDLQRKTKASLASVKNYAVIQSHGRDVGFLLHPKLGRALLESGKLRELLDYCAQKDTSGSEKIDMGKLDALVGNVIYELSKR
jgi:hypothetical protein